MTPFTQQVLDHERSMWSKDDLAKYSALIEIAQRELAKKMAEMTCQNCGENYTDHEGINSRCPHPDRFSAGNPIYIEGQYFRGGDL